MGKIKDEIKKILIVDDDEDILEPICIALEEEGYIVDSLSNGSKTLKRISEFKPDVVFLDVLMSGSDGRTICKKLKKGSKSKEIPIVMMSAHPTAKSDSLVCGADAFLAKPFDIDKLIETANSLTK